MRKFKYNPVARECGSIEKRHKWFPIKCECCGNKVLEYVDGLFFVDRKPVGVFCLDCIATGRVAREFNGSFIFNYEKGIVKDKMKIDELTKRTPGYHAYSGMFWLACCEDFCEYLGETTPEFLDELGIFDEVVDECDSEFLVNENGVLDKETIRDSMGDFVIAHLFRCLHCGKYRLYIELNL